MTGGGITWNYGDEPVEGYSQFLLLVIMAGVLKAGSTTIFPIKVIGTLLGVAVLPVVYLLAREVDIARPWASASVLVYALVPAPAFWAVAGLGTCLFTFLLAGSTYLCVRSETRRDHLLGSLEFGAQLPGSTGHENVHMSSVQTTDVY